MSAYVRPFQIIQEFNSQSFMEQNRTDQTWAKHKQFEGNWYMYQVSANPSALVNTVNVPFFIVLTVFSQWQEYQGVSFHPCVRVAALPLVSKIVTRDNGTQSQRSRCTPGGRNILLTHILSTCMLFLLIYTWKYIKYVVPVQYTYLPEKGETKASSHIENPCAQQIVRV